MGLGGEFGTEGSQPTCTPLSVLRHRSSRMSNSMSAATRSRIFLLFAWPISRKEIFSNWTNGFFCWKAWSFDSGIHPRKFSCTKRSWKNLWNICASCSNQHHYRFIFSTYHFQFCWGESTLSICDVDFLNMQIQIHRNSTSVNMTVSIIAVPANWLKVHFCRTRPIALLLLVPGRE